MIYSSVAVAALLVQFIINKDVFEKASQENGISARLPYRHFLLGVSLYYLTDLLWGVLDELGLTAALYADTVVYFAAMALSVFLWTRYVVHFLNEKSHFIKLLSAAGWLFMIFETAVVAVNFFTPVLFSFDESGAYTAGRMRHLTLILQIVMFMLSSVYTFVLAVKTPEKRRKYSTIGSFGIGMSVFILIQIFNPLLPLYSMGCLIGTSILRAFVHEEEKSDYIRTLTDQQIALGMARKLAYTDPLTGLKSKYAYFEDTDLLQDHIDDGMAPDFAVAVFDVNGLKRVNDEFGHEAGDRYILDAKELICGIFKNSPVYRIGGDEFAAILTDGEYKNRYELLNAFDVRVEENLAAGSIVVSGGISDFSRKTDKKYSEVFRRADKLMYERKQKLKETAAG